MTKALAKELGLSGIRVNCVAPGVIDTDMNRMHGEAVMQELAEETSLGKNGAPEDVAEAIYWLASEQSRFVTGTSTGSQRRILYLSKQKTLRSRCLLSVFLHINLD